MLRVKASVCFRLVQTPKKMLAWVVCLLCFCFNEGTLLKSKIHVCVAHISFFIFFFFIIILALRLKPRTVLCLSVAAPLAWRLFSTWWRMWRDELVKQQKREANKVLFLFCIIVIHFECGCGAVRSKVSSLRPETAAAICTQTPRLRFQGHAEQDAQAVRMKIWPTSEMWTCSVNTTT